MAIISDGKVKTEGPKPANKGLAWTHRIMEEVYDARYEREQVRKHSSKIKRLMRMSDTVSIHWTVTQRRALSLVAEYQPARQQGTKRQHFQSS